MNSATKYTLSSMRRKCMARKRIRMKEIRQILELYYEKKLTQRQIALLTRVSRPTVKDYIKRIEKLKLNWEAIKTRSEHDIIKLILPHKKITTRKKRLLEHFETSSHELSKKGMTRMLLWEEYAEKDRNPYGYSQYCYYLGCWFK